MPFWVKLIITMVLYFLGYWSRPHVDAIRERMEQRRRLEQRITPANPDGTVPQRRFIHPRS